MAAAAGADDGPHRYIPRVAGRGRGVGGAFLSAVPTALAAALPATRGGSVRLRRERWRRRRRWCRSFFRSICVAGVV